MASVTYKSATGKGYIFPVTVSNVESWVEITPSFTTADTGVQSAIEAKAQYTSGKIVKSGNYTTAEKARVTTDVKSGVILTSEINTPGTDYVAGDIITMSNSAGEKAIVRVLTVVAVTGAIATYEIVDGGTGYVVDGSPSQESTSSAAGAGFEINILTATPETAFPEEAPFKFTQFSLVVNFTQAKEVLRAEPYNVHHMKLKTPEAVMAQAKEHSVEFPNWVV